MLKTCRQCRAPPPSFITSTPPPSWLMYEQIWFINPHHCHQPIFNCFKSFWRTWSTLFIRPLSAGRRHNEEHWIMRSAVTGEFDKWMHKLQSGGNFLAPLRSPPHPPTDFFSPSPFHLFIAAYFSKIGVCVPACARVCACSPDCRWAYGGCVCVCPSQAIDKSQTGQQHTVVHRTNQRENDRP